MGVPWLNTGLAQTLRLGDDMLALYLAGAATPAGNASSRPHLRPAFPPRTEGPVGNRE